MNWDPRNDQFVNTTLLHINTTLPHCCHQFHIVITKHINVMNFCKSITADRCLAPGPKKKKDNINEFLQCIHEISIANSNETPNLINFTADRDSRNRWIMKLKLGTVKQLQNVFFSFHNRMCISNIISMVVINGIYTHTFPVKLSRNSIFFSIDIPLDLAPSPGHFSNKITTIISKTRRTWMIDLRTQISNPKIWIELKDQLQKEATLKNNNS